MKIIIILGITSIFSIFILEVFRHLCPESELFNIESILYFNYWIIILITSVIFTLTYSFFFMKKNKFIDYISTKKISKFAIFLDYFSLMIPNFLFSIGWLLLVLIGTLQNLNYDLFFGLLSVPFISGFFWSMKINVYNYFFVIDSVLYQLEDIITMVWLCLFLLSPIILVVFILLKQIKYDRNSNITLAMANDVFTHYIYINENLRKDKFYTKKFSYYFRKSIDNIDRNFPNGVKINNLNHDKITPIKQVITDYLHIYLMYGTKNEIDSFKHNFTCITTAYTNEKQINSLKIIKDIFKIYINIKDFLAERNYQIQVRKYLHFLNFLLYALIVIFMVITVLLITFYRYLDSFYLIITDSTKVGTLVSSLQFLVGIFQVLGTILVYLYKNRY